MSYDPDPEDVELPNGVELDDVEFESDVVAFAKKKGRYDTYHKPFNPQNGRWYEDTDPGCAHYDNTHAHGGLTVNCAYDDCSGFTTVEVSEEIRDRCPECGEGKMGRAQFGREETKRRTRHKNLSDRTEILFDDYSKEMNRLTEAGAGPVAAMDYIMCSIAEIPYEEWAEARDVGKHTVKQNIKRVANALGETVTYKTRGY